MTLEEGHAKKSESSARLNWNPVGGEVGGETVRSGIWRTKRRLGFCSRERTATPPVRRTAG